MLFSSCNVMLQFERFSFFIIIIIFSSFENWLRRSKGPTVECVRFSKKRIFVIVIFFLCSLEKGGFEIDF